MKKIAIIIVLFNALTVKAQDNNDILLGVYIPEQAEPIPNNASRLLQTRMYQLVTTNGISGNFSQPRFFLLPRIAVLDKEVLPTAPPRIVLNLELTMLIGDGEKENRNFFQTETITLKGVGQNEQKAYMNAIKNIKPKNPKLQSFLSSVKTEIITYYEENCEKITKKAYSLHARDKTDEAAIIIANIPIASSCYSKNEKDIRKFYQSVLERDCDSLINVAKSKWFTNQTLEGAEEAGKVLAQIEPRAYCKDRVNKLYQEISTKVSELGDKEWELKLKIVDTHVDDVKYTRELILKHIENQPNRTIYYGFRGW